jgi:hypothetical protein
VARYAVAGRASQAIVMLITRAPRGATYSVRGARALVAALVTVGSLATAAVAQNRARVDLYDKDSRRTGYAIVDRESGRIDTYDKDSRRTGYGIVQPDGRFDRYRTDGTREGSAQPERRTR